MNGLYSYYIYNQLHTKVYVMSHNKQHNIYIIKWKTYTVYNNVYIKAKLTTIK